MSKNTADNEFISHTEVGLGPFPHQFFFGGGVTFLKKSARETIFHLCPTLPKHSIFLLKVYSLPITKISALLEKNPFLTFSGGAYLSHMSPGARPAQHPRGRAPC